MPNASSDSPHIVKKMVQGIKKISNPVPATGFEHKSFRFVGSRFTD